jgi:signal peptidase I
MLCYGIMLVGIIAYPVSQYRKHRRWSSVLSGVVKAIALYIITAIFLRYTLLYPCFVAGDGMIPTAQAGERLIGDRTSYWFRQPERQDLVLLELTDTNGNKRLHIARIIGLPKEKFEISQGNILFNNEMLEEPYLADQGNYRCEAMLLPPEIYFAILDNRVVAYSNSSYCNDFFVKRSEIVAKITSRVFSWEPLE